MGWRKGRTGKEKQAEALSLQPRLGMFCQRSAVRSHYFYTYKINYFYYISTCMFITLPHF